GEVVDELPGGDPQLDFVVAGTLYVAGDRDQLGAGRGLCPDLGVVLAAHADDVRNGRERLDVVDQGRAVVETLDRRERRLQAWVPPLALQRIEQARLLAAAVG